MLRERLRTCVLAMAMTAAVATAVLLPSSPAWAEDDESPALQIPSLTSEPTAPISPQVPEGEPGLEQLPPSGPITPLAPAPPLPYQPDSPMGPERTVVQLTTQSRPAVQPARGTGTGSTGAVRPAPGATQNGAQQPATGAETLPTSGLLPSPVRRVLVTQTHRGLIHGTPYSYKLAF